MMLPEFKKILFITDLSKNSPIAFAHALSLASRYGASITILHVMEELTGLASHHLRDFLGEERWEAVRAGHEEEARQVLIGKKREANVIREALGELADEARKVAATDVSTDEIVVSHGEVVEEILLEVHKRHCDLIVMGYHVRGRLEEALLGSTSRRLLRNTQTPVLLVRLPEEED
jgi:nucleotide-binding universal stress UspA family protein